jgi:pyruvate formate lyase activating enzyme
MIVRDWYDIRTYRLDEGGRCLSCHAQLPGVFDGPMEHWGRRRLPVIVASR